MRKYPFTLDDPTYSWGYYIENFDDLRRVAVQKLELSPGYVSMSTVQEIVQIFLDRGWYVNGE